ncbi:MAG: hypothetical protein D6702_05690 [Planctomycetota bacterium]|nr:MAG: hypothetical protein D6702_05690 [Planctomycetota bacterium]
MRALTLLPLLLLAACMRAPEPPRITPTSPHGSMPPMAGGEAAPAPEASSGIHFPEPEGWTPSDRQIMFAEKVWDLPGGGGASLSVVGGSVEANLARWSGPSQFQFPDGRTEENFREKTIEDGNFPVRMVVMKGTLVATKLVGGGPPREGWTMVGAAVTDALPGGRAIYLKVAGPSDEMEAQIPAIEEALRGIEVH